jgi:hypothetical protein
MFNKMKYKKGDLVLVRVCDSDGSAMGVVMYDGSPISVYDTWSPGRSHSTYRYSVLVEGKSRSCFEEEMVEASTIK